MAISKADFEFVRDLIRKQAAIVLSEGKESLVESRLFSLIHQGHSPSIEALIQELRSHPYSDLHRKVVDAMTTNETLFFRDVAPFDALRDVILPEFISSRASDKRINIWSAASSTGQEAYSISMIIRERLAGMPGWDFRLLGTDISANALEKARKGRYSQLEVNRGLPAPMLLKHFTRVGMEWEISETIRKMVDFKEMNLASNWPVLPQMDIVFMRNVLIYFEVQTKKEILAKVRKAMRPDGVLFLGGVETTLNIDPEFERVVSGRASFYRIRKGVSK
jgi:chemotaxis protein methyltransferase CheR